MSRQKTGTDERIEPHEDLTMSAQELPDFDTIMRMAQDDPDGLEAMRLRMVEALIDQAGPERSRRLRGLQFQIDMARERSANPLAACIRISAMMQDSLLDLQRALSEQPLAPAPLLNAEVIPLARVAD